MNELVLLFREQLEDGRSVKFSPRGISMLPMLRQGVDSVVLSPLPERLSRFDLPLYQRNDGAYVLHRVVAVADDGVYTCVGDNQFTLEPGLRHDQMIAVVTEFYRGQKSHLVTEPGYRLYCWAWHYSRGARHFLRRCVNFARRRFDKLREVRA